MTGDVVNVTVIKKQTLVLVLVFVLILLLVIASPFIYVDIKNSIYKKSNSSSDYLNGNYVSYNGGEKAKVFFDRFVSGKEYRDVSFKYRDNENAVRLHGGSYTVFVLDLQYEENVYKDVFDELYQKTDQPDKNDKSNYYGNYLNASVVLDDPIYLDNYCGIFFNVNDRIIRYVFLKGADSIGLQGEHKVISSIYRSVDLKWD